MNCDCPRSTGIIHYEECPLHDPHSCAVCECDGHGSRLKANLAVAAFREECAKMIEGQGKVGGTREMLANEIRQLDLTAPSSTEDGKI